MAELAGVKGEFGDFGIGAVEGWATVGIGYMSV